MAVTTHGRRCEKTYTMWNVELDTWQILVIAFVIEHLIIQLQTGFVKHQILHYKLTSKAKSYHLIISSLSWCLSYTCNW